MNEQVEAEGEEGEMREEEGDSPSSHLAQENLGIWQTQGRGAEPTPLRCSGLGQVGSQMRFSSLFADTTPSWRWESSEESTRCMVQVW